MARQRPGPMTRLAGMNLNPGPFAADVIRGHDQATPVDHGPGTDCAGGTARGR